MFLNLNILAKFSLLSVGLFTLASCWLSPFPKDARGSLLRARDGKLRVGVSENIPWVDLTKARPSGIEPHLVRRFASRLNSEIVWVRAAQSELLDSLDHAGLELVIAGLQADSPYASEVAITTPYFRSKMVVAHFPSYSPPIKTLDGIRVGVKPDSFIEALVKAQEGLPFPLQLPLSPTDLYAGCDYELEAWGASAIWKVLKKTDRVMAVAPGENAFLMELERFLNEEQKQTRELLRAEAGGLVVSP